MQFKIEKKLKKSLGRAGVIKTAHGEIRTPQNLLGIGEPEDIFGAVENGVDLFDFKKEFLYNYSH